MNPAFRIRPKGEIRSQVSQQEPSTLARNRGGSPATADELLNGVSLGLRINYNFEKLKLVII